MNQSKSGGIPVNFSLASVSYNLYKEVKCIYHKNPELCIPNNYDLLKNLSKSYYSSLSLFLTGDTFKVKAFELQGESFYEVLLIPQIFNFNEIGIFNTLQNIFLRAFPPSLILPKNILSIAKKGISKSTRPFIYEESDNNLYIDKDRIGLRLGSNKELF